MSEIVVSTQIPAPPEDVWAYVRDISSHVEWMADAESITFTSESSEGVGTSFDCVTKVGPIKLLDKMEITEWEANKAMGVKHSGIVTGTGVFTLDPSEVGTEFTWSEKLEFPLILGGKLGAFFGRPILKAIWRRNLKRLTAQFE